MLRVEAEGDVAGGVLLAVTAHGRLAHVGRRLAKGRQRLKNISFMTTFLPFNDEFD